MLSVPIPSPRLYARPDCVGCGCASAPLHLAAYDAFDPASLIGSTLVLDAEDAVRFAPFVLRSYLAGPVSGYFLCATCFASATGLPPGSRTYTPADGTVPVRRTASAPLRQLHTHSQGWARQLLRSAASLF